MAKRANKEGLASTGSSRRDRETHQQFSRLCARVPVLQAASSPARAQLTQIVFGGLSSLRASEDRSAELCDRSLSKDGCALCQWTQRGFCEACGTDFARTQSRAGYPMFLPMYDGGLLHIDVCMLCSEACVEKLMASKERMQAEKEAAKSAASGGGRATSASATSSSSSSAVRVTRSAADPHHSTWSLLFHVCAYALTLYTLFLADYSVASVPYYLTAWTLLSCLVLYGLFLVNLMLTCTAGGNFSSVARLRQVLSVAFSVSFVLCAGMTTIFWTMAFGPTPHGIRSRGDNTGPVLEQLKHTAPMVLLIVELVSFPHVKINRWVERILCVLVPSLFLVSSFHLRHYTPEGRFPYPFMTELLTTHERFATFAVLVIAALFGLTLAFQRLRDYVWRDYIVPKHLQIHS